MDDLREVMLRAVDDALERYGYGSQEITDVALAAIKQAGFVVVPREATNEMLEAAGTMEGYDSEDRHHLADEDHKRWYRAMIEASNAPT